MEKGTKALEEKVAFLEDSINRLSRAVEEMNIQLVGVMKEVHNIRRTRGTAEHVETEDAEHAHH